MQKKILLASSALLATGLIAHAAAAEGVTYSITADIAAYTTLVAPAKQDNGYGFYKDAVDAGKSVPNINNPKIVDDDDIVLTVTDGDGVSGSINLGDAANGAFNGSASVTGENGITFSGAIDATPSLTVTGSFGSVKFNDDTAVDHLDINGDDAAVGIGGAGNAVYHTEGGDVDNITFVSSTIAGGAQVAVSMINVYDQAMYVATDGDFALKEAGALDFEVAAKYSTGPISAFFGFGTHAGSLAIGAKFSQNGISAAFGFSQASKVVEFAASASDDLDLDGAISAAEVAVAVAAANVGNVVTKQSLAKADPTEAETTAAATAGERYVGGAQIVTTSTAAVEAVSGVTAAPATDGPDGVAGTPDDVAAVVAVEAAVAVAAVPKGKAALNSDFVDANKMGGIAFSAGYTTGAISVLRSVFCCLRIPTNMNWLPIKSLATILIPKRYH